MSDEEGSLNESNSESLLTTEFRDGQLQIVEVAPFKQTKSAETHILPDMDSSGEPETRYVQVLNGDKSVLQLDLLNMTLVRCGDGSDTTYKLVANADSSDDTDTVTCVLRAEGREDRDNQDASYVMVDGQETPLVFLQSESKNNEQVKQDDKPKKPSAMEILEKAKALKQTAESINKQNRGRRSAAGRKRKSAFPPPHELLASPNFKLFLYSCKMCHFKCNAVKEMTAHKAEEHSSSGRVRAGRLGAPLQCARCPHKAASHSQLVKHVQDRHLGKGPRKPNTEIVSLKNLDSKEVDEAHVLVCGACGFECDTKSEFKVHIRDKHGATIVSI